MAHLFQEGIIDKNEWDEIEALPTPWKQNSNMIKRIHQHPKGYNALIELLRKPEQRMEWIVEKLFVTDT